MANFDVHLNGWPMVGRELASISAKFGKMTQRAITRSDV